MSHPSATLPAVSDFAAEALSALRELVGPDAEFRADQLEAIEALVEERRRVLVVQRTGWGKSAVYFVATRLLRARGAGPDAARLSPARAHAQPDRGGRARRRALGAHHERQRHRVGAARRRSRRRPRRPPARLARAVRQPAVPRDGAAEPRVARRPPRDRRGALHQRLGPRLPARLPPAGARARSHAAPACRCCAPPRPRTTGSSTTSSTSSAPTCSCCAVRSSARASRSTCCISRRRPSGWRGSRRRFPTLPGTGIVYALTIDDARRTAEWLRLNGIAARAVHGQRSDREPARGRGAAAQTTS